MTTVYKTPKSAPPIPFSVKQFGVFQHIDPQNINDADAVLVETAPDFNSAYYQMREHAADEASQRPEWGLIDVKTSPKTYDVLGHDGAVRISYEIATIHPSGIDVDGDSTWTRQPDWRSDDDFRAPPEHYGMYIDLDLQNKKAPKHFLVGGFTTLGEATDAMKRSAHAYLADHTGARLHERALELVGPKGETRQRYQIVKGRWTYGEFVKEDTWLQKEELLRKESAYPSPDSSFDKNGSKRPGNHRILPLGDDSSSPARPSPLRHTMPVAGDLGRSFDPALTQAGPSRAPAPAQVGPFRAAVPMSAVPEDEDEDIEMADDDVEMGGTANDDQDLDQEDEFEDEVELCCTCQQSEDEVELWCTCQQLDDGLLMIGCENDDCPIQWYHGRCVGLTAGPEGAWYCPQCAPAHAPAPKKRGRPKGAKNVAKATTGGKGKAKAGAGARR